MSSYENLVARLRKRVLDELDPIEDEKAIADISSFLSCGYDYVSDNTETIERFFDMIIRNYESFFGSMPEEDKKRLPDGVERRMSAAYAEAIEYRQRVRQEQNAVAMMAACRRKACAECGICADPD